MASDPQWGDPAVIEEFGRRIQDDTQRLLFADAAVGVQVQRWIESPQGRYIVGRASVEVSDFIEWALSEDCKPEEFEKRRAKALAARTLVTWTLEQIRAGHTAESQLRDSEQG